MPRNAATWTREQARAMAIRGNLARWHPAPKPVPEPPPGAMIPALGSFGSELLHATRARIRSIGATLDSQLSQRKVDGATIDRLASALERLAELERRLDGRPLPGTRRPGTERPAMSRPAAASPIMPPAPFTPDEPPGLQAPPTEAPGFTEYPD